MATKVINGTVRGADGLVKAGAIVVISLSQPCTLNGTDEVVTSKVQAVTNGTGNYSVNLYSNSDLTPGGTFYSVNESALDGSFSNAFSVVVPAGAGPFIMAAIQVATPAPSPPGALDSAVVHLATAETITGVKTFSGRHIIGADVVHSYRTATETELVAGLDASLAETVYVNLTISRVMGLPANPVAGHRMKPVFTQPAGGNCTVTLPAGVSAPGWTVNLGANAVTELPLEYNGATSKWIFASNPPSGDVLTWGREGWNVESPQNPGGRAQGDTRWVADAAISTGTAVLTSATAAFSSADQGKVAMVAGAGAAGILLNTTIQSVQSATSVTLAANAGTTVSGANACIASDDYAALQAAIRQQQENGGAVELVASHQYLTSQTLTPAPGATGAWTTATRDLIIHMNGATIVAGQALGATGIFGYGRLASTPITARVLMSDGTLDGNYLGVGGGVIPQSLSPSGALCSLNWPYKSTSTNAYNGLYHEFTRVRFYRPNGYTFQPSQGIRLMACTFDQVGQPDLASGVTHLDCLGSGQGDAIALGCVWKDSSGNYADFVDGVGGAGHIVRLIMIGCESYNHQIGGIFACGLGSVISMNTLNNNVAGSGIGYDAGTVAGMRSKNIVTANTVTNLATNASGLSFATYGDVAAGNISSDSNVGWQAFAPVRAESGLLLGGTVPSLGNATARVSSDGTSLYVEGNGGMLLRPFLGSNNNQLRYVGGVWQTYDGSAAIRNVIDDGSGGMAAKGGVTPGNPGGGTASRVQLFSGTGVPNNANGNNGDLYFRQDGGAGTTMYQRRAGVWAATAA